MTEFTHFDTADYLTSQEQIVAYLEASAETGDPAQIVTALGAVARSCNMVQLAREAGLSREGIYKALSPDGNPAFATVAKVADALGLAISFRAKTTSASI